MELLEKQLQKETKNNQYQGNKKYKHNNPQIPENQLKKHFRGLPQTVPAQWKQLGAIYTNDGGESYIFNKQLNDNFPAIITKYSMPKYLSLAFKLGFFDKNEMKQTYDNLDLNQQKKVKFFLNQNQFIGVESEDINTFHLTHDPFNEIDDVLNFIIERNKKYQNLVKIYSQSNIAPLEQAGQNQQINIQQQLPNFNNNNLANDNIQNPTNLRNIEQKGIEEENMQDQDDDELSLQQQIQKIQTQQTQKSKNQPENLIQKMHQNKQNQQLNTQNQKIQNINQNKTSNQIQTQPNNQKQLNQNLQQQQKQQQQQKTQQKNQIQQQQNQNQNKKPQFYKSKQQALTNLDLEKNGFFNTEEYMNNQKKAEFIINYYKTHLTEYYWDKVNIKKQDDYVSQIQQIFQQNFNFLCADKNFNYKAEEIKIPGQNDWCRHQFIMHNTVLFECISNTTKNSKILLAKIVLVNMFPLFAKKIRLRKNLIEDEIMTNKQTYQELLDSAYIYRNQQNEDSNELQNPVFAIENELNTTFQLNPINNNFNLNTSYINNNNTSFNLENNERQNDFSLEALVNQNNISNNNSLNGDNQIGQNIQNQKDYIEDHIFNNQINDNNNNEQNDQNDLNYLINQDDEISEDLPEIKEDQLLKKLEKIKQVIKKIKEQNPQKFIGYLALLKEKEHDKMLKMFQVLEKTINESSNYCIEIQQSCIKQKNYSVAYQIQQKSKKTNRLKIKDKGNAEHQLKTVAHVKALMKACVQFFDYNEPISQFENLEINQIVQYISDIRYDFLLRKYCNQEIQVEKVIPQMEIKSSDSEEKVIKKRKKNDIKEMEKNLLLLNKQHEKEQKKIQQIKNEKKLKKRNPGTLLNFSKSKVQNQFKLQDDDNSSSLEILQNFNKQPLNINIVKKQDNSNPVLNTRCKKSAAPPLKQVSENDINYNDNENNYSNDKDQKNAENEIIDSKNDKNYMNNGNSQNDSNLSQSSNNSINNDDDNYPKKVKQKSKFKKTKKLSLSLQSSNSSSSDDDNKNINEINYTHTNKNYLQKEKNFKQNRHLLNQIKQVKPQQQISKNLLRKSQKLANDKEYLGNYKKQTQHSKKSADKYNNNNLKKPVTITISDSE